MARYNEIMVGRFNRWLQKLLSMKGPASLTQLAPELQTAINAFSGVEDRYLQGWDRFGALFQTAGAGAIFTNTQLRNPVGSNVIAVIELINFAGGAATDQPIIRLGPVTTDQALTIGSKFAPLDSRGRAAPTLIGSSSNTVNSLVVGGQIWQGSNVANGSLSVINDENQEITVNPGIAISLNGGVATQQLNVSLFWRERLLEESERT